MEVSDDLVDADATLEPAPFLTLRIKVFGIVFALALFHAFAAAKGPRNGGIGIADFVARVAAAGFGGSGRGRRTVAFTAVVRVEVCRFVLVPVVVVKDGR